MAINKVIYGGNTLIDLSSDTVTTDALVEGQTAHNKAGVKITGTNPYEKTATDTEVNTQTDLISQIKTALAGKAAGGGSSSSQPCEVSIVADSPLSTGDLIVNYVNADGELMEDTFSLTDIMMDGASFTTCKGSIIVLIGYWTSMCTITNGQLLACGDTNYVTDITAIFSTIYLDGDTATITFN